MSNHYIRLYANCIAVSGVSRAIICDLQNHIIHEIPFQFKDVFNGSKLKLLDFFLDSDTQLQRSEKDNFIQFLLKKDLAFYCSESEVDNFPEISLKWDFPSFITNCILDAKSELWYFCQELIQQLETLCCYFVEIRYFETPNLVHLQKVVELINLSSLKSCDLILKSSNDKTYISDLIGIVNNSKISFVVLHSSLNNNLIQDDNCRIIEIKEEVKDHSHCGVINPMYFSVNTQMFSEAQQFNTCLNRKISVDYNGEIKNCPSMSIAYGNIKNLTLEDVYKMDGFKSVWRINKDQIEVCKQCEYRYICTDCRAYLEDPLNIYSKPLKCGYNPNTGMWSDRKND